MRYLRAGRRCLTSSPALVAAEQTLIFDWINAGAQNN
jgi:hypothetical protein